MAVITISREAGCGGDEIARAVASVLGYVVVDKQFVEEVLDQYGFIEFDAEYDSIPTFWARFNAQKAERRELMINLLNQVIHATAQHGNVVILGRSGFMVLAGYADVLNVRLQAPVDLRVIELAGRLGGDLDQAEAEIDANDRLRRDFIKHFYGADWADARAFDLVIDTGKLAPEPATRLIADAAGAVEVANHAGRRTTAAIAVDNVMQAAVEQELAKLR